MLSVINMQKTSIRFYNGVQVRAIWVDDTKDWWYSATDLIAVLTESKNPRIYWNTLKTRNSQMNTFCRQLKLTSKDGKKYLSDVINEQGIIEMLYLIPSKNNLRVQNWIKGMMDPIDEKSKRKAYDIFDGDIISNLEVGTFKGLQQIHSFIFGGLYEFAGQLREKNISKGGFVFGNCLYLKDELNKKKVFIVTDSFLYKNGYTKVVTDQLDEMGIQHTTFYEVAPDPTLACAIEGAKAMKAFEPDTIIAIGGGSAMDAAKIMWVLYEHPEVDFFDMAMRFMDIRKRIYTFPKMGEKAYFIAVPTSAGTGSEVTSFAVLTDKEKNKK
mgnify:CR=1 FL=1